MKNRNLKGFTLIELIIVIAIVAVLTAILVPTFIHYINESKLATANANAKQVYTATQNYCTSCKSAGYYVNSNNSWESNAIPLKWDSSGAPEYAKNGDVGQLIFAIVAEMGGQDGVAKIYIDNSSPKGAAWSKRLLDHYVGLYPQESEEKLSGTMQAYHFPGAPT